MHEYGVAAEIVAAIEENSGGRKIISVDLAVGDLSGVFTESLTFYLDMLLEERFGTAIPVKIRKIPAQYHCSCGRDYDVKSPMDGCPSCGTWDRTPTGGTECFIESIEVEE